LIVCTGVPEERTGIAIVGAVIRKRLVTDRMLDCVL
jgi:hypothetical protein